MFKFRQVAIFVGWFRHAVSCTKKKKEKKDEEKTRISLTHILCHIAGLVFMQDIPGGIKEIIIFALFAECDMYQYSCHLNYCVQKSRTSWHMCGGVC